MEVQSPQSVQINFNNKIITLHNVTIVKNPKIITIDASQYSNLLKGSQIKLPVNGATTTTNGTVVNSASLIPVSPAGGGALTTPVKTQIPNLIPVKTPTTPVLNNVIKQIPKLGVLQLKSPVSTATNAFKLQSVPVVKSQSTVVISPPKNTTACNNISTPMKVQLKPFSANSIVINKPQQAQPSPTAATTTTTKSTAKVIISPPQKHKLETSPTSQPDAKKLCQNLPFCCIFCKDVYEDSNSLIEHMKKLHPESVKLPGKIDSQQNGKIISEKEPETPTKVMISNIKLSNLKPIDASVQQKIVFKSPQLTNSSPKIVISPKMLENNKLKPVIKSEAEKVTAPSTPPKAQAQIQTQTIPVTKNEISERPAVILKTSPVQSVSPQACTSSQQQETATKILTPEKLESNLTTTTTPEKKLSPEKVESSSPAISKNPSTSSLSSSSPTSEQNNVVEKVRKKPGRKPKYPEGMKPVKIKRAYNKTGKYSKAAQVNGHGNPVDSSSSTTPPVVAKKRGRKPKSLQNPLKENLTQKTIPESMKYLLPPMTKSIPNLMKNEMTDASLETTKSKSTKQGKEENHDIASSGKDEHTSDESDDESEVNDLLMDVDDEQDSTRSSSPESPEYEEVYPLDSMRPHENDENGFDYDDYEYCSNIMEPICELSCEEESDDENQQDENDEAMRLYREAMEMNYQTNGIKKRGRRRKKVKPLMENFDEINGILAGLLEDTAFKVPKGPGRGRRKEMNEQELEMERINGACLFSCNKCDETFKYAGDLAKHVRSHTINSPYQCTICQRKFTHIGSLNTHLRIHSGERPYKCNQCDKSFTQSNSLMVHVKSHLSNKPYQCLQCNKGFLNASSLALHQKTHAEPTSVICPIDDCGKEFRDNNLLEEHMQTHKQSLLYQCSLCSEKFENSATLVQHVKTHIGDKPFQCNQCGKCFTQPGSLNTHLRIHTGEKPFKCEVCGKSFTQASSLSVHMKVHGEKEFKCLMDNCNRSFGQEIYLKKHMLKHIEKSLNDENAQLNNE